MGNGLFDYVQRQEPPEPPQQPTEPRQRTPFEISQAEQQRAIEAAQSVYRDYQKNIMISGQLQTEIEKGMQQGKPLAVLFLQAMKIISNMTGNAEIYRSANETIQAVYGYALQEPGALELTIAETQSRLERLESALQIAEDITDRARIENAVKAHKRKLQQMQGMGGCESLSELPTETG